MAIIGLQKERILMLLSMRVTERILYILNEYHIHIDLNSMTVIDFTADNRAI